MSGFGITSRSPRHPSLIQRLVHRHPQDELSSVASYCARLYYRSSGIHSWEVYVAIMWNLELHIAAADARYAETCARMGPDQEVMFERERITLDIPMEGVVLENGWTITPRTYPVITKVQVDRFVPGHRLPSCQLHVKWTGQQEQPVELVHRVELLGAKEPCNFFYISLPLPPPQTPLQEPPSSAQESKPDDEPNMESPSPKHPNPLLSQTKMEPLSPKEEVKPKLELSEVENVEVKTKLLRKEIAFLRCLLQGSPLQGVQTHGEPSSVKSEPKPPIFERGVQTYTEMTTDVRTTGAISTAESTTQMAVPRAHEDSTTGMKMMSSHIPAKHALGIEDLADITVYLHPLGRTAVFTLGVVLGLDYPQLRHLIGSPDFRTEVLAAWLHEVQKAGVPTWRRLVEALRDPRVGQNAIASKIEQDRKTGLSAHELQIPMNNGSSSEH